MTKSMPIELAEVRLAGLDSRDKVRFGQAGEAGEVHQGKGTHRLDTILNRHRRGVLRPHTDVAQASVCFGTR